MFLAGRNVKKGRVDVCIWKRERGGGEREEHYIIRVPTRWKEEKWKWSDCCCCGGNHTGGTSQMYIWPESSVHCNIRVVTNIYAELHVKKQKFWKHLWQQKVQKKSALTWILWVILTNQSYFFFFKKKMLYFETWDKEYEKTMGAENLHKPEDEN